MTTACVLIAYDGSPDARTAITEVARLLPGAQAIVLYARQSLEGLAAHLEGHRALEDLRGVEEASLDASERIALEGAERARAAGLDAEPRVLSRMSTASEAIVQAAEEIDAALIVLGSRGRRGLWSAVLGSTSTNVLHHARRPTMVVPSEAVVSARQQSSKPGSDTLHT
ncbi:universal stress protein UspA [Mycolicibacterium peregrinum]|uniref:Universal stress protein UspA n=1 Tax=Mycolicibacterium peregrinum TaxID=43304 RepID=A0A1A0QT79_MYCPR|nr:universal stress protein [Mycolicibacterium peregrinum]OBB24724.1 universal stress protein UspA [Mycolicibacterium peregrinum]